MCLPTAVTDILWQIAQSTAQSLAEKLEQTLISDDAGDAVAIAVQHHPSYLKAMADYWQRQRKREQQLSQHSHHSGNPEFVNDGARRGGRHRETG